MEKQKFVQKEWYEDKPLVEGNEIIWIRNLTYIMAFIYRNLKIEKRFYRIRERES